MLEGNLSFGATFDGDKKKPNNTKCNHYVSHVENACSKRSDTQIHKIDNTVLVENAIN